MSNTENSSTGISKRTSITINQRIKKKLNLIGMINQSYAELIEQILDWYIKTNKAGVAPADTK